LLEQRDPLREDRVLVGELGNDRRVVQQNGENEERRDREEDRGRIRLNADPTRDRVQAPSPGGEREQHDACEQPEQRVPLAKPAAHQEYEALDLRVVVWIVGREERDRLAIERLEARRRVGDPLARKQRHSAREDPDAESSGRGGAISLTAETEIARPYRDVR